MRSTTRGGSVPVSEKKVTAFLAYSLLILLIILLLPAPAYALSTQAGSGPVPPNLSLPGTPSFGAEAPFNSKDTANISAAALTDTKFVVAYQDNGNSGEGTAVIGDVDVYGNTITYGPIKVFNTNSTEFISVSALSSTKFVVAYADVTTGNNGQAVIGSVSGNTITYGPEETFNPALTGFVSTAALSPSKFVVSYCDVDNWLELDKWYNGQAVIGDVSGNIITYGPEKTFNAALTGFVSTAALSPSKFVVSYSDFANWFNGTAVIGDVSGNIITYGPEKTFNPACTCYISTAALSPSKFVVAYQDNGNWMAWSKGTAVIGDVSGNTIAYGTESVFNPSYYTMNTSVSAMTDSKFVVSYLDYGNSDKGTAVIGAIYGNQILYGAEAVFNGGTTAFTDALTLSPSKFVVAYRDIGNSNKGTAIVGGFNTPSVRTDPATGITYDGATLNGNITDWGGEASDQRGFQYRVEGTGAWTDINEQGPFPAGAFNLAISGLSPDTTYEFKARAHNSAGWGEGAPLTFSTSSAPVVRAEGRLSTIWYLAEGSTAWGFNQYVTIINPNMEAVTARVTYMTATGPTSPPDVALPALSQTTINPKDKLGQQDFSTKVECLEGKGIAVDRTMTWTGQGAASEEAHNSIGVPSPATTWYLPEGSSAWGFECWLLIQNPNDTEATCNVTYMIEGTGPKAFTKKVPANSRRTYDMSKDIGNFDASIKVESDIPVIPERAMYRNNRREGHDSIGTTAPATDYYLAEGTSAWGFTTYVLVQNPQPTETEVTISYMTPQGPWKQPTFKMPANSRKTIRVNDYLPNTDLSTHVHGNQPIIAERAMYWGADKPLGEACHDSVGMAQPHTSFYLPDGQTSDGRETWTLVQNPNDTEVTVDISYLGPAGQGNVTFTEKVPMNSRRTFNMADRGINGRAAVTVTCKTEGKKIMVERAMYWNSRGAGTDTIGGYSD